MTYLTYCRKNCRIPSRSRFGWISDGSFALTCEQRWVCWNAKDALCPPRLQSLTARDLEKQERERAANSLEAFIFETQVGGGGRGRREIPAGPASAPWMALSPLRPSPSGPHFNPFPPTL